MYSLTGQKVVWPSAFRGAELIAGVNVPTDPTTYSSDQWPAAERSKRGARTAFGQEEQAPHELPNLGSASSEGVRHLAGMFGMLPDTQTSTSFLPGYAWWPATIGDTNASLFGGGATSEISGHGPVNMNGIIGPSSGGGVGGYGYDDVYSMPPAGDVHQQGSVVGSRLDAQGQTGWSASSSRGYGYDDNFGVPPGHA